LKRENHQFWMIPSLGDEMIKNHLKRSGLIMTNHLISQVRFCGNSDARSSAFNWLQIGIGRGNSGRSPQRLVFSNLPSESNNY
jgi:hypothetical protein